MPGHRQSILYVGGSVRRLGLAGVVLLAGCASFLPHSENDNSTFKTFAQAQHAVASLVPMHSDMETLKTLGIDPLKLANAKLQAGGEQFDPGQALSELRKMRRARINTALIGHSGDSQVGYPRCRGDGRI